MVTQAFGDIIHGYGSGERRHAPALVYGSTSISWLELDRSSNRAARLLRQLGVVGDDFVAVMLANGASFHEAVLGIWKAGATPLIIPPNAADRETLELLQLGSPRIVIGVDSSSVYARPSIAPDAWIGMDDSYLTCKPAKYWKAVASGGSSGRPKIIVDHSPAEFDLNNLPFEFLMIPRGGVVLNPGPLHHNLPFAMAHLALLSGAKLVGMYKFEAEETLRLIEAHRVNFVALVPTMMHRIWALPKAVRNRYDLSSLTTVWHMAAPCPVWLKQAWIDWLGPDRIWEAYAGTEAGGTVISGRDWLAKPGSVGKIVAGALRIVDAAEIDCKPNEVGEIMLAPGSIDRFHYVGADLASDAAGRVSLGDLGHVDEDGFLFLADRRSDLIIRGGANIYPAEIEALLNEHPDVESSIAIGLPCTDLGQRVHAILHFRPGSVSDVENVADFVSSRLVKYKWPETYEVVDTPLRNDAGKARRSALRAERLLMIANERTPNNLNPQAATVAEKKVDTKMDRQ